MGKQRIFAWKRIGEGRQPGFSGQLSLRAAGAGALCWHPAGDGVTLLHSPQVPWGKPSPLGHRLQVLQIVQGWDKGCL